MVFCNSACDRTQLCLDAADVGGNVRELGVQVGIGLFARLLHAGDFAADLLLHLGLLGFELLGKLFGVRGRLRLGFARQRAGLIPRVFQLFL